MKYEVIYYYKRYSRLFSTKAEATNAIKAKALTSKALHYTELWEMKNETDGQQLALFEGSQRELKLT